jgi:hypothetical protein
MKIPLHPAHPERTCWGCDLYCPALDLRCGNGTERTMHPCELLGDDWLEWEEEQRKQKRARPSTRVDDVGEPGDRSIERDV